MQFIQYIPFHYRGTLQASVLKSLTEPFKFSLTHFGNISAIRRPLSRRLRERWSSPSLRKRSEHDANEILYSSNSERGTYSVRLSHSGRSAGIEPLVTQLKPQSCNNDSFLDLAPFKATWKRSCFFQVVSRKLGFSKGTRLLAFGNSLFSVEARVQGLTLLFHPATQGVLPSVRSSGSGFSV